MKTLTALILAIFVINTLTGCASVPNLTTKLEHETPLTNQTKLGVKSGEIVVQRKVNMAEKLRSLQIEVFELEKGVYGDENNRGLYGVLKDCRKARAMKTGELEWTEPRDLVVQEAEPSVVGFDESKTLVGLTEEKLQSNLDRFLQYRDVLLSRRNDLQLKLDVCEIKTAALK